MLVREVGALYVAHQQGRPSPLPPLTIQYADYAVWQRQWLRGDLLEKQLDYWRHQLAGAPAVLELPLDRPRPAVRAHRGGTVVRTTEPAIITALEALAQRGRATLFMALMAAFQGLLHCYSGQTDVVVGTDVANRDTAETESLIGFFINQLVVRLRMDGDPTFLELLEQTRRVSLGAFAHQDTFHVVTLLGGGVAVLLASLLLHHGVERPVLRWRERLERRLVDEKRIGGPATR